MKKLTLILISVLSLISIYSCNDEDDMDQKSSLKVAALLDLSAHYSQFGIEAEQAMELALNEVENIEMESFDTKADIDTADQILDNIIQNGDYDVVVTLASWISNGLAEKINSNNMMQIAIGSAVFNYEDLNSTVRFTEDVDGEGDFLLSELEQYDSIAVMYFDNDYGNGWYETLSSGLGNNLIASEKYPDSQTEFQSELETIKQSEAEATVLISTAEAADITDQASEMSINTQFIGTRPTLTVELLEEPTAEGLQFSYPNLKYSSPEFQEFENAYGYKMAAFGAEGYDVINSLSQFYEDSDGTINGIYNQYTSTNYSGLLGDITFDENGQASYPFTMMVVENGTFNKL